MGFERVSGIMQCTKGFTDFSRPVSNYESDVFRPLFDELQRLSGQRYTSTLPAPGTAGASEQEKIDVAFRVIADHIRTLSFRHRRRHPARQYRPPLRAAPHPAPGRALRTRPGLPRAVLLQAGAGAG
jgi:hypothetical protein